jgi:hypothetical protein
MGKWIRRRRPSPGTAFGFAALVIALGGAAFAAIPDPSGMIHGCYLKNNGSLRVVDSAADCKSTERSVSWSAGSEPGSGIVARATSTEPASSNSPTPFDTAQGTPVPLTGGTWTQQADETDDVYGVVEITPPPACQSFGTTGFLAVGFFIDGERIGGASSTGVRDETLTIALDQRYVYEPGSPRTRTLTARAADTCQDGNHFTVDSVRVSVNGIR